MILKNVQRLLQNKFQKLLQSNKEFAKSHQKFRIQLIKHD